MSGVWYCLRYKKLAICADCAYCDEPRPCKKVRETTDEDWNRLNKGWKLKRVKNEK